MILDGIENSTFSKKQMKVYFSSFIFETLLESFLDQTISVSRIDAT